MATARVDLFCELLGQVGVPADFQGTVDLVQRILRIDPASMQLVGILVVINLARYKNALAVWYSWSRPGGWFFRS